MVIDSNNVLEIKIVQFVCLSLNLNIRMKKVTIDKK